MIGQSLHQMLGLSQVQFRCLSDLINLNILKKPFIQLSLFFPAIIQAQHGCDSFWLAIREFWASLAEPDSRVQVQFSVARWLGDDFWDIVVDLHVSDYLLVDDHVQVRNVDSFEWIDLKVDPVKTRRFQFEERPLSCATGTVRLAGKLRMTPLSPKVELLCRVCSKDSCFDPQKIKVPLVGQNDNVPGGGHIDQCSSVVETRMVPGGQ